MSEGVQYYLREVLGISHIVQSRTSADLSSQNDQMLNHHLIVLAPRALNPEEETLLAKMMKAIGVDNYSVTNAPLAGPGLGLVVGTHKADPFLTRSAGDTFSALGRRWVVTHDLEDLIEGTVIEIQTRKREAWNHLQRLKRLDVGN